MTLIDVYNLRKEKISETELKDEIFSVPVKEHVLHEVVVSQVNRRRAGTAACKSRSLVNASTRKLYRQKGTGRARAGSASSPTRRGGGVAFGPQPRAYVKKVSKKVRKAALRMALSDKLTGSQLFIVEDFSLPEIKTKSFVGVMRRFDVTKALIVTADKNEKLEKSSRNVPWVKVLRSEGLNVYDLLKFDHLFLEKPAIDRIEEALIS
ncbi:50S ribosomal protein L4 [Desulfatiglans anilini]|uniref:50S ribosomal protein L4 n=1 Tax=Desulfatiglans anilini TaxID=90728 RepID=UPI0004207A93